MPIGRVRQNWKKNRPAYVCKKKTNAYRTSRIVEKRRNTQQQLQKNPIPYVHDLKRARTGQYGVRSTANYVVYYFYNLKNIFWIKVSVFFFFFENGSTDADNNMVPLEQYRQEAGSAFSGFFLGLYDDHRLFPAFFTAICQGILGCATPLWPNFRPKIRQRDATVAGKVRARDTTMAYFVMGVLFLLWIVHMSVGQSDTPAYPNTLIYSNI